MSEEGQTGNRINLDQPFWDQSTYLGRLRHFFWLTDPRTVTSTNKQLNDAKELVEKYRLGQEPPGTTESDIREAKQLYESSFHPDSGDLQNVFGRMSFQVPGGMLITGAMLQWYRTTPAVIFWQWLNQSFNALVNYTNRNAASDITTGRIAFAYVTATTSAIVTAVGLKGFLARRTTSTLLQRFVPFAAVASANMVNIPLMRQSEIIDGIAVFDENDNHVTESKLAAVKGVTQVTTSRISMAAPGMLICPLIMERLEKFRWMQRISSFHIGIQTMIIGCSLLIMVPAGCALFPQRSSISVSQLRIMDSDKLKEIQEKFGDGLPETLYFNKGL